MDKLFILEKELKSSPKGKVLLLRHKETKERFVYRELEGGSEAYRKLATLRSPHLPHVEKVEERDGKTAVLEEYVQGDTLAFLLRGAPFPAAQVRRTAMQLCRGLETLHGAGIVHRDVKPENVILRGEEAVLIDFDVSRIAKPQGGADTQVMGTAGYAAPEQYGFSQTDARADIYAMGVLLNEMLTGEHPSKKLAEGVWSPIIRKCIEVNADRRYTSAAELYLALERMGNAKKQKGRVVAAILAAAVIIASALLLFKQRSETPAQNNAPQAETNVVQTELDVWEGIIGDDGTPVADPCRFFYDLDGDGAEEEYVFCTALYEELPAIGDEVDITDAMGAVRVFVPAVWRVTETGEFEMAEEFAPLLEEPSIRVWRGTNPDAPVPKITAYESLWQGGIRVDYTREHVGAWIYETTATLGGMKLRAVSKTMLVIRE